MRIAFAWAVTVSGIVACGMFLGGLSRGGMRVPMMMLGILGVGVAGTGARAVAKERRRSVRLIHCPDATTCIQARTTWLH